MNAEVKTYYDKLAAEYDSDRFANSYGKYIDAQERSILDKLFSRNKAGRILDLACGTGRLTEYATDGLDISAEMISIAKQKHPSRAFKNGSAHQQPYEDAIFDTVFSFHAFMHFDAAFSQAVFQEIFRVLKPGGTFVFDIPSQKRRALLNYQAANWHGAQSMSSESVREMLGDKWSIQKRIGIAMLPIHRLPKWSRSGLRRIDSFLCRTFLKEYASYIVFILEKK